MISHARFADMQRGGPCERARSRAGWARAARSPMNPSAARRPRLGIALACARLMMLTPRPSPDRFPFLAISPDGPKQPLPGPQTPEPTDPPRKDPQPAPPQRDPEPSPTPQRDPQREPPRQDPPASPPEPGDPPPDVIDPPLPDQPPNIIGEGLPAD
jgi:hypothetical protein